MDFMDQMDFMDKAARRLHLLLRKCRIFILRGGRSPWGLVPKLQLGNASGWKLQLPIRSEATGAGSCSATADANDR